MPYLIPHSFWFSSSALKLVSYITFPQGHNSKLSGILSCIIKFLHWWAKSFIFAFPWKGRLVNVSWRYKIVDESFASINRHLSFPCHVASDPLVKVPLSGNPLSVSPLHSGNSQYYPHSESGQWNEEVRNGEHISETWLSNCLIRLAVQTIVWEWVAFLSPRGSLKMRNLSLYLRPYESEAVF